jgi:broad specificity phosphatase PhoE
MVWNCPQFFARGSVIFYKYLKDRAFMQLPTKLILVRHAETEANLDQVWQGDLDAPLTARGLHQVKATADRLAKLHAGEPIDVFYVSPLPRAQSTASAIAKATGLPLIIEYGLREFGLGDWEGRSFRELREVEDLWGRWEVDPAFAPPNGESPISFNQRAVQTLATLAARHPGQTILVVTHGAFISSVLATWLGADPRNWRQYDAPNCALSVLVQEFSADAGQAPTWRGALVNDISHLPSSARVDYESEY